MGQLPGRIAAATTAICLVAGMAEADEPPARESNPPPHVTYVRVRYLEDRRVELSVRARDPDATVTEVDIDWGDRRGTFATNACIAFVDGEEGPHTGKTISFRRIRHRYAKRGPYKLRVNAVSHLCPEHTGEQVGPRVKRIVRIRG
jgi:hypothetical protein